MPVPFALRVAPSTVPNSGLGVFIERGGGEDGMEPVPANTVVALYSGVYFPVVPLHASAAARGEVVEDVIRLTRVWGCGAMEESLSDATFEEGSSYWLFLEVHGGIMDGFRANYRVGSSNPFAVGQLINHPQRGIRPNVEWQDFSWSCEDTRLERVNRLHRGFWYVDPVTSELVNVPDEAKMRVPGVAIVSRSEIKVGEELFLNYRFHSPYPAWYSPVEDDDRAC